MLSHTTLLPFNMFTFHMLYTYKFYVHIVKFYNFYLLYMQQYIDIYLLLHNVYMQ
jgi:hypothetical protein